MTYSYRIYINTMKKVTIYILFLILLVFLIPIFFTKKNKIQNNEYNSLRSIESNKSTENNNGNINQENYDYKEYNKVKLLHNDTNKIEELDLDTYLLGVVSSEMPANFEIEALKAQAVVARTYTVFKIKNGVKHKIADICDDPSCCQAWISKKDRLNKWKKEERDNNWSKIENAVNSTKGKIITYKKEPINAFFHSNSGGITETASNVWGGDDYPYLKAIETSGEDEYNQYRSEVIVTKEEFIDKIKEHHNNFKIDFNKKDQLKILEYTEGKRIKKIKIGNLYLSGVEIRNIFKLKSANFIIDIKNNKIKFNVIGYGHGVGMSQTGANSMAKDGKNYEEIIRHYYSGVDIVDM